MGISISGVRVWVYIPLHAARVVVLREECLVVILSCNFSSLVSCLMGRRHGYLKVVRGFFLSRRRLLKGVCFISFQVQFCTMWSRVKRRVFVGRVFLVGVGWIWAWSAGKEKIALYQHLIPGPSVFLSFKSGVTFFLWVWHWSCLFSFQYRSDFTAVYQHHMDDISVQQLSLWVVLPGNAHKSLILLYPFGMSLGRSGLLQLSSDIYTLYLSFISPSLFLAIHPLELTPSTHLLLSLNAVMLTANDGDLNTSWFHCSRLFQFLVSLKLAQRYGMIARRAYCIKWACVGVFALRCIIFSLL